MGGAQKAPTKSTEMDSDLRVGGKWIMKGIAMENPFSCYGEYTRIDRPDCLNLPGTRAGRVTIQKPSSGDLNEKDGITTVRVTHSGLTPAVRDAHKGWPQVLGWLKA